MKLTLSKSVSLIKTFLTTKSGIRTHADENVFKLAHFYKLTISDGRTSYTTSILKSIRDNLLFRKKN